MAVSYEYLETTPPGYNISGLNANGGIQFYWVESTTNIIFGGSVDYSIDYLIPEKGVYTNIDTIFLQAPRVALQVGLLLK